MPEPALAPAVGNQLLTLKTIPTMATNKPMGDDARKRAVRKRGQLRSKVMGRDHLDQARPDDRKVHGPEESAREEEVQGRAPREDRLIPRKRLSKAGTQEVARLFREYAQRTALRGGNPCRSKAYSRAADSLAALAVPLDVLIAEGRLTEI